MVRIAILTAYRVGLLLGRQNWTFNRELLTEDPVSFEHSRHYAAALLQSFSYVALLLLGF